MTLDSRLLEKPLPKPSRDPIGYASARLLEALLEAILALRFLEEGYTRNAAGKAFQAWRALTAAILALEKQRVSKLLASEEERRWLEERGIPRLPSTRLRSLARLVEETGYEYYTPLTDVALNLHDYQYHGPDPDLAASRYRSRAEAASDIVYLLERLVEIVEARVKERLAESGGWGEEHTAALEQLKRLLKTMRNLRSS